MAAMASFSSYSGDKTDHQMPGICIELQQSKAQTRKGSLSIETIKIGYWIQVTGDRFP